MEECEDPQTHCFNAFTAKHFTTVRAGFALTRTSLPKAMRLPAFVAGLCLVLTMHTPGIVNLPVLFASLVASSARASNIFAMSALFVSQAVARASATAPFGMAFTPFIAFIDLFIAFFPMAYGFPSVWWRRERTKR